MNTVTTRFRKKILSVLFIVAAIDFLTAADANNCGLLGRVGASFAGGGFVPATGAKVYVLYSSEYVDRGFRDKFFTHHPTLYTAGGQFIYHFNNLIEHDNELKGKNKAPSSDERALEIAEHMLKHEDDAIAVTLEWADKHPKDAWQVRVIVPDDQGLWAVDGLRPGSYEVVVRGTVSRIDAVWSYSSDLEPGKSLSLGGQPRYFRPLTQ